MRVHRSAVILLLMMFVRHVAAFLALPFVAAVVVPVVLPRRSATVMEWGGGLSSVVTSMIAVFLLAAGLILFGASLHEFITRGRGTLAPWDPPRELVVQGPYRYVRNPMISGVLLILIAEAIFLRSASHGAWAAIFATINAIYIPLVEEPQLERRFGTAYRDYCRRVPRLVPRLTPVNMSGSDSANRDRQG